MNTASHLITLYKEIINHMKKFFPFILFCFLMDVYSWPVYAQVSAYTFTALSGSYIPTGSGATKIIDTLIEGGASAATNIGFSFTFDNKAYSSFQASALGYLSFNGNLHLNQYNNYQKLINSPDFPLIAPLYDDEETGLNGGVFTELSGNAPNQVLTIEWRHMRWWWSGYDSTISYEVKLYETSNRIEFVYNNEPNGGLLNVNTSGPGATIGLADSSGFISVLSSDANPAISSVIENDTIHIKPVTGQAYRFDPLAITGIPVTTKTPALTIAKVDSRGLFRIVNLNISGELSVYDVTGKLISQAETRPGAADIDLTTAASGIYFISMHGTDGSMYTVKLVK